MPATIKRSAQNSNVYEAYGILSSDTIAGEMLGFGMLAYPWIAPYSNEFDQGSNCQLRYANRSLSL